MVYKFKHKGFSLIEVLMTLMVLSLVLVLMLPLATKKLSPKNSDGVVYTYGTNMSKDDINSRKCFITRTTYSPNAATAENALVSTNECSEYEFTVPNGVHSINLTLVAGGGGGGGASGLLYRESAANTNASVWYSMSDIKKATIEMFTGYGYPGAAAVIPQNGVGQCASGKGGSSSAAIVNYEIPSYMYKKFNLNRLVHERYTNNYGQNDHTSLFVRAIRYDLGLPVSDNSLAIYQGKPSDTNYTTADFLRYTVSNSYKNDKGETVIANDNNYNPAKATYSCEYRNKEGILEPCGTGGVSEVSENIPEKYFVPPHEGMPGHTVECARIPSGTYLLGGEGGFVNENTKKGQGLQGANIFNRNGTFELNGGGAAWVNNQAETLSLVTKMSGYEDRIVTGGGGSGGNAVRIIGFKVNPGETYIIRVGKGGKGGAGGQDYIYKYKNNSTGEQIAGKNATGGTSTSIWRATKDANGNTTDERLIFMVTGGAGGEGAYYNASSNNPRYGRSAGIQAEFLYGDSVTINDIKLDEKIAAIRDSSAESGPTFDGNPHQPIQYAYLRKETGPNMPYAALNKMNWGNENSLPVRYGKGIATNISNTDTDTDYYSAIRGFSWFNHPRLNSPPPHLQSYEGSVIIEGEEYQLDPSDKDKQINRIYNGFYYRNYIKDNEIGYVGGLGGFSGLGGKAGCGGYFMGNSQGIKVDSNGMKIEGTIDIFKNKFIVRQNNTNTAYDVGSYYDNCSIDTPNGQSAKFVMPSPKDLTFGQAGAGGGGGGYSANDSSGYGGDGQNGYLMIDWRK